MNIKISLLSIKWWQHSVELHREEDEKNQPQEALKKKIMK